MTKKPTYEELEQRVKELENETVRSKRAEETLRESEARLVDLAEQHKMILDALPQLISFTDANLIYRFVNRSYEKFFECKVEDIVGRSLPEVIGPAVWELAEHHVRRALAGEVVEYDEVFEYPSKETRHMMGYLLPHRDATGSVDGYFAVLSDVTRLFAMQEALRESEERFRRLYEQAPLGYQSLDEEGCFIDVNQAWLDLMGYSREQVIGRWFGDFLAPHEVDAFKKRFSHFIATGEVHVDLQMVQHAGSTIIVHMDGRIGHDERGQFKQTHCILYDITERKQAEEALKQSKARLELATAATKIGHWDWDLLTNEVYFSPLWKSQLGYEDHEIPNRFEEWETRLHPDDRDHTIKAVMDYIEGRSPEYALEFRLRHKDGSYRWIYTRADKHFDENGKAYRLFGCHIDITERKRMEEELLKMEKLESVGVLAGGIAHDFNNILGTILGNVSLAKLEVKRGSELFDLLDETEKASHRAHALTKQLLTFSRGGAPVKKTASISQTIKDSSLFVLRGSKSRCEFSIAEDLWPVEADVGQISQVIHNIVINATQAMPEGGIIQIRAENRVIGERYGLPLKAGRYIRISIRDQGIGVSEEHLIKIFDPYFTTKQQGSGLGLATSYSIIKKHDGHITVESQLGVGTTFHIYFPASKKEALKEAEKKEKPIMGQGKILMMDDDEMLRRMGGRILTQSGYEVKFAEDGAEAIQIYQNAKESGKPFDAVILDLTVPGGMGGKEAVKRLLEIDPEVKAIVSSGYSNDPVLSKFREYGFRGVVPKPYEVKELSSVLDKVMTEKGK